ncbi:hypothetical protein P3T25_005247 [Paraburkholderia sp. GAS32]
MSIVVQKEWPFILETSQPVTKPQFALRTVNGRLLNWNPI